MVSTRRRAVQRDKAYCAGDKIEVVRTDGIDVGILLRKEEDEDASDSSVTHWLVSVEGGENEEEWISEKSLGRVLAANDSSDDNSGIMSTSSKSSPATTMTSKKSKNGGNNNNKNNMKVPTKKSTSIKHSKPTTTAAAAATATNTNNKNKNNKNQKGKSSKSGRSRRVTTRSAAANSKNENGKSADLIEGLDNIDTLITKKVPSHRPKPKKEKDDETVVEVKMLTGTLFIYRGRRRRVEFIRTS